MMESYEKKISSMGKTELRKEKQSLERIFGDNHNGGAFNKEISEKIRLILSYIN